MEDLLGGGITRHDATCSAASARGWRRAPSNEEPFAPSPNWSCMAIKATTSNIGIHEEFHWRLLLRRHRVRWQLRQHIEPRVFGGAVEVSRRAFEARAVGYFNISPP